MVNAGGSSTLELVVVDANGGSNTCTYMEIAVDGIYLDQARAPAQGKTFIPPSSKVDWLIVCNTPGTYQVDCTNKKRSLRIDYHTSIFRLASFDTSNCGRTINGRIRAI